MADNVELNAGSGGAVIKTDDDGTAHWQYVKMAFGADNTQTIVTSSVGLPVGDAGGSLTVDAPAGTPVFVRLSDGSAAISTLPVSLASVPSHAVTNAGTFAVQAAQSGTWTVDLGATDNAVLDAIAASLAGTLTVGSHAVTNAGTFAVQVDGNALTALQLIDNTVYVDDADWTATSSSHNLVGGVYQSTPGTITDGDTGPLRVNANGALHVAIVSGGGTGGTAQADDADFVAGTTQGTPAMGVYESSPSAVTDGDLGTVGITANRAMLVHLVNGGSGGTSAADDADFTAGSTSGTPAMGVYESSPTSVTDGDMGMVGITQTRAMRVSVDNTVTVASHAVTNAGTFVVQENGAALTALQLLDDTVYVDDADWSDGTSKHLLVGGLYQSTPQTVTDGDVAPFNITANGALHVAIQGTVTVASHAVTNAGTFAVQVDGNALTALQLIDDTVYTDDAAFTPGTSKLTVIGAQADEDSTDAVDEGDAGALRMTLERKLRVVAALDSAHLQSGNDQVVPKFAAIDAASSGDNTIVAAVASKKLRVLSAFLVSAGTVNVRFESGAGGTALTGQMNLVANSGFTLPFNPAGWFETAANTLLNIELSSAVSVDGCLTYIEVD